MIRRNARRAAVAAKHALPVVEQQPAVEDWPDDDEPDLTCPQCGGSGADSPESFRACPHCDGEGHEWWRP